jgi:hypothetical protein
VPDVIAAVIGVVVGLTYDARSQAMCVCGSDSCTGATHSYLATKHWIVSNVLGLCFSISGITYLSLGSYKVGAILLVN